MPTNYIIILAGGNGNRLQSALPKQFVVIGEKPILMHTISAFYRSIIKPEILLVLNRSYMNYWMDLCEGFRFTIPHTIVEGGPERYHSTKNALAKIDTNGFVGIHDGVRPFIPENLIKRTFSSAYKLGNATPAVPAVNTIRFYDNNSPSTALNRSHIYVIQNPQVFKVDEIKAAYNQEYNPLFTDDATVAEHSGLKINLIPGDRRNIKITHPIDLVIARAILEHNRELSSDVVLDLKSYIN